MKAIVDGLEMFCNAHRPGTAVCDGCGTSVTWDKYSPAEMEEALRGWSRDGDNIGAGVVCPGCIGNTEFTQ